MRRFARSGTCFGLPFAMTTPSTEFLVALAALRDSLDELGVPAAIIGGVSVIARGIARFTEDIAASIDAERAGELANVLRLLARHGFELARQHG